MAESAFMGWDVQTVSVVVSGIVAVSGVAVPAWTKRGDRRHDLSLKDGEREHEKEMLREKREDSWKSEWWQGRQTAYLDMARVTQRMIGMFSSALQTYELTEQAIVPSQPKDEVPIRDVASRVDVYGSDAVKRHANDISKRVSSIVEGDPSEFFERVGEGLPKLRTAYDLLAHTIGVELRRGPATAD